MIKKTITDPISELLLLTPFVLDHRLKQRRKERENEVEKIDGKRGRRRGVETVCQTCLCSLYECSNFITAISGQCLEVTHTLTHTHLFWEGGWVDAVEVFEAVLQHAQPHGALHHIHTLQLEVVHWVKGHHPAWVGLHQSQEFLGCRGDGLTRRIKPVRNGAREKGWKEGEKD